MAVLMLLEHADGAVSDSSLKTMSAVKTLGGDVHVLCLGSDCGGAAEAAAKMDGVAKVIYADDARFENRLAEPAAAMIASIADRYEHIVAPATASGKNIMARVAGLLDVMLISDIIEVRGSDTFVRPIYAGNAMQTVKSTDTKKVITVRTAGFSGVNEGGTAVVEKIDVGTDPALSSHVSDDVSAADRPQLTSAKIVISGGRGMGSGENFAMVERVADKLGAAVGASRAAVDAGYAPNDYQVGQTGKVVAPDLYIAVGISGAIQHLAGMKDSKVIVAINKDAEAPIFQVADYGLVADLFEAIPQLEAAIDKVS
jgi:electron transfer flavoprotein alpha subunit